MNISNETMQKIQCALILIGHATPDLIADGENGPETEASVKLAQAAYGLEKTGKVDQTLVNLIWGNLVDGNISTKRNARFAQAALKMFDASDVGDLIPDGVEGPHHEAALADYQDESELETRDGALNDETWNSIITDLIDDPYGVFDETPELAA